MELPVCPVKSRRSFHKFKRRCSSASSHKLKRWEQCIKACQKPRSQSLSKLHPDHISPRRQDDFVLPNQLSQHLSITCCLMSEKSRVRPSLAHFSCDPLALDASSWIRPSSSSRKHIPLRCCSIFVWGFWQIRQWTSLEGFLETAETHDDLFSVTPYT